MASETYLQRKFGYRFLAMRNSLLCNFTWWLQEVVKIRPPSITPLIYRKTKGIIKDCSSYISKVTNLQGNQPQYPQNEKKITDVSTKSFPSSTPSPSSSSKFPSAIMSAFFCSPKVEHAHPQLFCLSFMIHRNLNNLRSTDVRVRNSYTCHKGEKLLWCWHGCLLNLIDFVVAEQAPHPG